MKARGKKMPSSSKALRKITTFQLSPKPVRVRKTMTMTKPTAPLTTKEKKRRFQTEVFESRMQTQKPAKRMRQETFA